MRAYNLLFSLLFFLTLFPCYSYNYPIGARSAGIGNASTTLNDVWSTFHNQAAMTYVKGISAGAYYENRFMLKELSLKAAAFTIPVKKAAIGFMVSNFGYKLYQDNKLGLSFAKQLGEMISAGIQFSYLNTRIAEGYGSKGAFAGEVALLIKPLKGLSIGTHIFNVNRASYNKYDKIPTTVRLGAGYEFSDKVLITAEAQKSISTDVLVKTGLEYKPAEVMAIRAGINASNKHTLTCLGFGYTLANKLQIDIAANYHAVLGLTSQIGLSYQFNSKEKTETK